MPHYTIYCCSETERGNAVKQLGGKPEITRFKGLGKIRSKEFAPFIGKEMVLAHGHRVEYTPRAESTPNWAKARQSGAKTASRKNSS